MERISTVSAAETNKYLQKKTILYYPDYCLRIRALSSVVFMLACDCKFVYWSEWGEPQYVGSQFQA